MTGYWSSSFDACLWTETKPRSINTQKKRTRAVNLNGQAWSIKDFNLLFSLRPYHERARQLHLARSCSQSQHEIRIILPVYGACRIILTRILQAWTIKDLLKEKEHYFTAGHSGSSSSGRVHPVGSTSRAIKGLTDFM